MSAAVIIEYSGTSSHVEVSTRERLGGDQQGAGRVAGRHRGPAVALHVLASDRVPEAAVRQIRLQQRVLVGVPAVVEREPRGDQRPARGEEQVGRGRGVDPVLRPDLADDAQRRGPGVGELARLRDAVGILELREHERVDPLGVGRPGDALRQLGPDVPDEVVAHLAELAQMAVVRQRDLRAVEPERVQVRLRDQDVLAVGDAADVRDQARRSELGGQVAQVAVEGRERRRPVRERILGPDRARVPRDHAEAGQVEERLHHPRAVGLANEGAVGVVQHVPQRDRLPEIRDDATHRSDRIAVLPLPGAAPR